MVSFFELFFDFSPWNLKSRGMCHKCAILTIFLAFLGFEQICVFSLFFETFAISGNGGFGFDRCRVFWSCWCSRLTIHSWTFTLLTSDLIALIFWCVEAFWCFGDWLFWFIWIVFVHLKRFDFNWIFWLSKLAFFRCFLKLLSFWHEKCVFELTQIDQKNVFWPNFL